MTVKARQARLRLLWFAVSRSAPQTKRTAGAVNGLGGGLRGWRDDCSGRSKIAWCARTPGAGANARLPIAKPRCSSCCRPPSGGQSLQRQRVNVGAGTFQLVSCFGERSVALAVRDRSRDLRHLLLAAVDEGGDDVACKLRVVTNDIVEGAQVHRWPLTARSGGGLRFAHRGSHHPLSPCRIWSRLRAGDRLRAAW